MPSSFTIRNTSDMNALEVKITGGGPAQDASIIPGEEQTFTLEQNSKVSVTQGPPTAQPKR